MSTNDWIKKKKLYWPHGSMEKFLKFDGSSNVLDALKKRTREGASTLVEQCSERIKEEELDFDLLAEALALTIILDAKRKGHREFNP